MEKTLTLVLIVLLFSAIQSCDTSNKEADIAHYKNWMAEASTRNTKLLNAYQINMERAERNIIVFRSEDKNKSYEEFLLVNTSNRSDEEVVKAPKAFGKTFQKQANDLTTIYNAFEDVYAELQDFFIEKKWEHRDAQEQLQKIDAQGMSIMTRLYDFIKSNPINEAK